MPTLPPEHRTDRVERLQVLVDACGDITTLPLPRPDDLNVIASLIMQFSYIEMNLRRALQIMAHAGLLEVKIARRVSKLQIVELVPILILAISHANAADIRSQECEEKLNEIEYRRGFRNILSHWACRRINEEDALVFMTLDHSDVTDGIEQHGVLRTAIMDLADLRGLVAHMSGYDRWLAGKVNEWWQRYMPP